MEQNSTAPSDWIHFGEEGWGRNTTQLPQTEYTLGRRGGGEKQHSSLRLDTLWGGGVAEWNNTMHSDWIYFGGWGGEAEQNVSLSSVHLGGGVGSNSKQLSSELVHLSTVKAIIVPASPLTAKLKFRIKMGWLDKIPKIEKKKGHSLTTFLQLGQQTVQHSQVQCMLSTHSSPSEFWDSDM